ncbi:MAG: hypothetical protein MMC33_009188 [Icmadophila ericetorum]|nr:hypothetical protein [Icmadophila ericetorum]
MTRLRLLPCRISIGTSTGIIKDSTHPKKKSNLQTNPQLWHKIHVLLYDLRNIASDHSSEKHTLSTTDELYISTPYFTPSESAMIKATIIEYNTSTEDIQPTSKDATNLGKVPQTPKTIEEAIKQSLSGFFDKRKASGDSRPCGPHDMAPIYEDVFGIDRSELLDERFLIRLWRSGLGEGQEMKEGNEKEGPQSEKEEKKEKKKMKKKGGT